MIRHLIFFSAIMSLPLMASAQITCDSNGNCFGVTDNGQIFDTYTDQNGNTSGLIGDQFIDTYTDKHGNTSGTVGDQFIDTYTDKHGNTSGVVGDDYVDCYTDAYGNTSCY